MYKTLAAALAVGIAACGGPAAGKTGTASGSPKHADAVTKVTGGRLSVVMSDYEFVPSKLTAGAGRLEVTAKNAGRQRHELVLLRTDTAPEAIPLEGGGASESSSVGEIGEQQPGKSATRTFALTPGRYVFICNVGDHYRRGMRGSLVIR
jgi:uncharacterized cupredoxin-like copper-binding protein